MDGRTPARCALFILASTLFPLPLLAQYVCDYGNGLLDSAPPAGIATSEIIEQFATRESAFKAARDHYGYTLDLTIQTLNGNVVDGAYHQVSEFTLNDKGARVERSIFAPQDTLRSLALTKEDLDDIRDRLPFVLTADHLSLFSVTYVGRQRVDELGTCVFDVAPKNAPQNGKGRESAQGFQGRIWVDDRDFVIVKTCGKTRGDQSAASFGRNATANLTPTFVTYREKIDGKFWFTTYARADEILHFSAGGVHIRELVKYSDFKALASKYITFCAKFHLT